jgi:hypothetical protein
MQVRLSETVLVALAALLIGAPPSGAADIFEKVGPIRHYALESGFGARAAGMGNCFTGVADDVTAIYWNPGGLAFMQDSLSGAWMYSDPLRTDAIDPALADWSLWQGAAGTEFTYGSIAWSFTRLSYGDYSVTTLEDPSGETVSPTDWVVSLGYAYPVTRTLGLGLAVKYYRAEQAVFSDEKTITGDTWAVDLGALYRYPLDMMGLDAVLRFGGALQHLGSALDYPGVYDDDALVLPRTVRLGASCAASQGERASALLCVDLSKSIASYETQAFEQDEVVFNAGIEAGTSLRGLLAYPEEVPGDRIRDTIALRIGYVNNGNAGTDGVSYGFGVGVKIGDRGMVSFDVANVPVPQSSLLDRPWRIGMAGSFTGW